jgi:hypothetical protein
MINSVSGRLRRFRWVAAALAFGLAVSISRSLAVGMSNGDYEATEAPFAQFSRARRSINDQLSSQQ